MLHLSLTQGPAPQEGQPCSSGVLAGSWAIFTAISELCIITALSKHFPPLSYLVGTPHVPCSSSGTKTLSDACIAIVTITDLGGILPGVA